MNMNIKTINTTDGVNAVDFGSAASHFYWFENLGATTVYVSKNENITPGGDNVAELAAGRGTLIESLNGKVYILGTGKIQITNQGDKFPPFYNAPANGGGGSSTVSNPNLLINPDFSINQRGNSSFVVLTVNGIPAESMQVYTVDRWRIMNGNANITDGKFVLNGTIIQVIENNIGADFTASVSVENGSAAASYDDTTKTFTITGENATLNWAKLEIGNAATGFSPPDITTEMLKCQRYYQVHNLARQRIWYYTADTLVFLLSNKVPMREGRTAEIHGTLGIVALDNKSQSGFNFVIEWATADGVKVRAEKTAHGLTDAILYVNKSANSGFITIDAEIY